MARTLLSLALIVFAAAAAAQDSPPPVPPAPVERPSYRVAAAEGEIAIDGRIEEAAWQRATVVPLRYETRPAENQPPPVATDCLLTYDSRGLYVAFRAHDPSPAAIRAHLSDRDRAFSDDFVGIVLDTFNDERRGFEFFVNPLGVQMDMFIDDVSGNEDESWDAIWHSAGRVTETGFEVEIGIPWSSLRFPRAGGEQTWGFDALRFYPRAQRHRISSHPLDRNVSCYLCQASKMSGFAGITPGRNVEIAPTVTASRTDRRQHFPDGAMAEGDVESDLGLTAKWGITPNLTLNAAVNPDFSQVEADVAQLDVNTQFALFFPEKRPFFLEGSDFFSTPIQAVFTRTVADPDWGVKLTGKEGKHAVGVFGAHDDVTNLIVPGSQGSRTTSLATDTTDAVLRYRRDLGKSSTLGALFTGREGDDYSNQVGGIDALYRLGDSDSFRAQALFSRTDYPDPAAAELGQPAHELDDHALWVSWDHYARDWIFYGRYEDVGADFRADMGFVTRVDYTFWLGGARRVWHGDEDDWYTRIEAGGDWDLRQDQRGNLLEEEVELQVYINGPLQSFLLFDLGQRERVFNGRTFDETFFYSYYEFFPTGDLFASLDLGLGDTIDFANTRPAEELLLIPRVRYTFGRHLRATVSHNYQKLEVAGGTLFTANLTQLNLVHQFSVRSFLRAILQYTDIAREAGLYTFAVEPRSERLFTQLLFSYKLNPQTVFFLGYSDNAQGDQRVDLTRADRTFFAKVGYAWVP